MAQGSRALHEHVATTMQATLGQPLPQMEVRLHNVSVSADIVVKDETDLKTELPTLINTVKMAAIRMIAKKHVVTITILRNFSGVFKPGSMTLVLGQPGSGKFSLLKLLAGRLPTDRRVRVDGEVTYNGVPQEELRARLPQFVSLVDQHDKHFPTLTVKETLEFAHACTDSRLPKHEEKLYSCGTSEQNQAALDVLRAMYEPHPDVVIRQLGLEACQDTILGNAMLRGVSGGERKRVTTGEMELGNKFVLLMDEISTGLDSAATFDIISTQRSLATTLHKTVVISLLQPSLEVFALFDDVILLNDGYVLYHGPVSEAQAYFERLGFKCPENRDVADFLLDLGTDKQKQYEVGACPASAREFADATSHFMHVRPEFHQSFWDGTRTLIQRQVTVILRNRALLKSRLLMSLLMGLLNGSTFFQFNEADAQVVIGMVYVAINFVTVGQSAQMPIFMNLRDVFNKQRGSHFFWTSSFVLATSVSQIPLALMETLLFGSIIYWMCGFVSTAVGYLLFGLVLFLTSMMFAAWFFFLAAVLPDMNVAGPVSQLSLFFTTLFCGFVITRGQMPDYMLWMYWLSPQAWSLRASTVNQYTDPQFNVCVYEGVDYCETYGITMSDYSLSSFDVPTRRMWLWLGIGYLIGMYIVLMWVAWAVLEFHRIEERPNVVLKDTETSSTSTDYTALATPRAAEVNKSSGSDVSIPMTQPADEKFIPVTLAFNDLWYSVPDPARPKDTIDLLKGVSGYALPGTITALMGSSGAGKTTLMDVIAGRKTGGQIRGEILLNGHPATELAIRRATGYCEQMDIHSDASTFREALTFSAFLRQDVDVPDSQKYDSVNECLELLDLHPIADQIIRGSSTEQMKRLTIGVELAAQPSVLFLDEPTSGLDARSAKLIVDGVRKVADTGRTVVCTIHQPSAVVFEVFDSLLLLKRGGEMVFFGDLGAKATKLVEYCESIDGVARLEKDYNRATWMLEVISAGVGNDNGSKTDFVSLFKSSAQFRRLESDLNRGGVARPSPSLPALEFKRKRAANNWVQAAFLTKRWCDLYWRTPSFNLTRFIVSIVLAISLGISYLNTEYISYQGVNSGMGMVYMAAVNVTIITFNGSLPIACKEQTVFYRERASESYGAFWYYAGATLVEIPYCFGSTLLFLAIFYPMAEFTGVAAFFTFWLNLSLIVLLMAYYGQFLAFLLPSLEVASVFMVIVNIVCTLFTGFNPPAVAIPRGYKWIYHIVPNKYAFASLAAIVFGDCPSDRDGSARGCQTMTGTPQSLPQGVTLNDYLETTFLIKHSDI
ncbi:pleiotropic drug resistance protein ABC superfamily [Phytophthora sojae]|uniref:Pleiotropic drug resistance protein ABC superfamily n=1 Tax=Phytophthora sojae (strain P6497) TaxID=1094619 RepID=G4ZA43_PHYSP|nr:pleiotropic drug resistance protein ABC superfamily [Phytophthora sojae]EGZ21182.1 pleiotropic drug resistance protein ABC superfamily [Phytophthora sojae]|eukprot:XP_009523899.1 pleiotropic drug resistance protein ABC superfamily [Phytophthora sojae]